MRTPAKADDIRLAAPVVIVHSQDQAVAALAAAAEVGRHIVIASAPDAGISAGAAWFAAMTRAARAAVPAARCIVLLDCGDDAGAAQAALRAGVEAIVFSGRTDIAERLADIAAQHGALVLTQTPAPMLDLQPLFFAAQEAVRRRCSDYLRSVAAA